MNARTVAWLLPVWLLLAAPPGLAQDGGVDLALLRTAKVRYVKPEGMQAFPAPVVAVRRAGLASGPQELAEINQRIVYPLLRESAEPIATIVVEFFAAGRPEIGVIVYWTGGAVHEALIARGADGHYDPDAYRIFFKRPTP